MFSPEFIIALVIAITIHEFSHAWMATMLGDPTARMQGRVSLNPLKHLDPIGTLLLFLVGIGWGKPVPFNPRYLKHPRRDSALIALAGPLSNLVVILILSIPFKMLVDIAGPGSFAVGLILATIQLNMILMLFNLLPIPPLDGSKIVFSMLPPKFYPFLARNRNIGYGILIALLLSPQLLGIDLLGSVLWPVYDFVWELIF
jgi:Zn-dependent protease